MKGHRNFRASAGYSISLVTLIIAIFALVSSVNFSAIPMQELTIKVETSSWSTQLTQPSLLPTLSWSEKFTRGTAPLVEFPSMAYDAAGGYAVLFGGLQAASGYGSNFNETALYTNGAWTSVPTPFALSPQNPAGGSIAYDSQLGAVLLQTLVGAGSTAAEETWEFHGGSWTQLFPSAEPTPRWYSAMAYDPLLNSTVLFGGLSTTAPGAGETWLTDTWVFANGTWRQISAGENSSSNYSQQMAYDPESRQLILLTSGFAGSGIGATAVTSAWTSGGWQQLSATSPQDGLQSLTYDPALGGLVGLAAISYFNQTTELWVWNGSAWTTLFVEGFPSATNGAAVVYDSADGYALMDVPEVAVNVSAPSPASVTWILSPITVGPPPQASISDSSGSILLGGSITLTGSVHSAFGYTWNRIGVYAPGCPAIANNASLTCRPTATGDFSASFLVKDQAGRTSNVSLAFSVTILYIPPTLELPLLGVIILVAILVGGAFLLRWFSEHTRPQPPRSSPSKGRE